MHAEYTSDHPLVLR